MQHDYDRPPMHWIADLVYLVAGIAYLPVALYNALVLRKNRRGWGQRFGGVPVRDPRRPRIWIHAVSLGEINATPRLAAALRERLPGTDIVFSTTTDTGYARGVEFYGADRVFRFPLDFSMVVARVLRRVRPTIIVLVELEVWYNLVRMATRRGIPVAVVNGRLTERSARRLRRLGPAARSMFADLAWVGAQDETIAGRFRSVGAPHDRVGVTSSLKWDSAAVTDRAGGADALAGALILDGSRPVWVCGSTGPGEEAMILDAYREVLSRGKSVAHHVHGCPANEPGVPLLVIVPRKPERFDEVARLIVGAGFACVRRSLRPDGFAGAPCADSAVILGDTMGELRKFYSLADVVFVGRSLVPLGGSDPMEVAALGKPIVAGPHMENFESPVSVLRDAGAIRRVQSTGALASVIGELLGDATTREWMGAAARAVVLEHQGATQRTVDQLVRLMAEAGRPGSGHSGAIPLESLDG
jgi:3-deoxy-D-manno-octulosonic-acid transferase